MLSDIGYALSKMRMDGLRVMEELRQNAAWIKDWIVGLRREFHQYPELAFCEHRTTQRIISELENMNVPYRKLNPTGVVGEIHGKQRGNTIVLRADMDALPINEETELPFQSVHSGIMHACGHDANTAMLLGAARILQAKRDKLCGNVRLVFQPAEETAKGAKKVIEQGVLDDAACAFAVHVNAGAPVGEVRSVSGAMFAASVRFEVTLVGKKCHAAFPHLGVDPVLAGCAVVQNLQSLNAREINSLHPFVLTIGSFQSDGTHNVLSERAILGGTIRTFNREARKEIREAFYRIVESTATAYRCTTEIQYDELTDVLINDSKLIEMSTQAVKKDLPQLNMVLGETFMGSEDFAEFTARVPCAYFTIGAKGGFPSHHSKFEIDEEALYLGACLYTSLATNASQQKC